MLNDTNLFFRIGAAFFGSALIRMGSDSLVSAEKAAREFGLPAVSRETLAYMPAWGIRDLGFGAAILALLAADALGITTGGPKSAAIVTGIGACVGFGDAVIVSSSGGQGAKDHAVGASGMAVTALGLWVSSS